MDRMDSMQPKFFRWSAYADEHLERFPFGLSRNEEEEAFQYLKIGFFHIFCLSHILAFRFLCIWFTEKAAKWWEFKIISLVSFNLAFEIWLLCNIFRFIYSVLFFHFLESNLKYIYPGCSTWFICNLNFYQLSRQVLCRISKIK